MSDSWDLPEGQTQCDVIADAIGHMRARFDSGQGQLHHAMCRLPLPMAEELMAGRDELRAELQNLLAVIHRDGGHYTAEHGLEKSVQDAMRLVPELRAERDELRAGLLPPATADDTALGWTLHHDTVRRVKLLAEVVEWVSLEQVEAVMMAMVDCGLAGVDRG